MFNARSAHCCLISLVQHQNFLPLPRRLCFHWTFLCLCSGLYKTKWFYWNLIEGSSMGQGRSRFLSELLPLSWWIQEYFFTLSLSWLDLMLAFNQTVPVSLTVWSTTESCSAASMWLNFRWLVDLRVATSLHRWNLSNLWYNVYSPGLWLSSNKKSNNDYI